MTTGRVQGLTSYKVTLEGGRGFINQKKHGDGREFQKGQRTSRRTRKTKVVYLRTDPIFQKVDGRSCSRELLHLMFHFSRVVCCISHAARPEVVVIISSTYFLYSLATRPSTALTAFFGTDGGSGKFAVALCSFAKARRRGATDILQRRQLPPPHKGTHLFARVKNATPHGWRRGHTGVIRQQSAARGRRRRRSPTAAGGADNILFLATYQDLSTCSRTCGSNWNNSMQVGDKDIMTKRLMSIFDSSQNDENEFFTTAAKLAYRQRTCRRTPRD